MGVGPEHDGAGSQVGGAPLVGVLRPVDGYEDVVEHDALLRWAAIAGWVLDELYRETI
jgi:hypothetical protein